MSSRIIDQYKELISQASKQVQGSKLETLWWAGYLSSKNRFYYANELILELIRDPNSFEKKNSNVGSLLSRVNTILRSLFYFSKVIRSTLIANIYEKKKLLFFGKGPLTVLTTFSYKKDFGGNSDYVDSFWGELPSLYKLQERNYLLLSFPLLDTEEFCQKSAHENRLLSVYAFLKFSDLWMIFKELFLSNSEFQFKNLLVEDVDISNEFSRIFRQDIKSAGAINSLVLYHACRNLSSLNLEKYFYIYEGNYWERLQLLALKEYSANTIVNGYQHNIVSKASFNYFPGSSDIGIAPFPDRILTTGEITAHRLSELGSYGDLEIIPTCAIRYSNLYNIDRVSRTKEKVVLVALEGLRQSVEMLNSIARWADHLQDWTIRVRTHPIFPIQEVRKFLEFDIDSIDNIEFSETKNLVDDLKASNIVLYWASTVALEALCLGVPVLNFKIEGFFDTDPIFDLDSLKGDFIQGQNPKVELERLYYLEGNDYESEFERAQAYLKNYLTPVSTDKLKEFF